MIAALADLFRRYDGGFTSFVLGQWLEYVGGALSQDVVRRYFAGVAEIGSHSYNHVAFQSTGDATREKLSRTIAGSEADEQLQQANAAIVHWLGVHPAGLRTPMGNIRPFGPEDRDVLRAIRDNGLRYVSSWLKAGQRQWKAPGEVAPFFYSKEGFESILEIPAVGAYDVHFVQPTKLLVFDEDGDGFSVRGKKMDGYYVRLLEEALRRSEKLGKTVFVPLVFHPHVTVYYDPTLTMHEEILKFCKKEKILVATYKQVDAMFR